MTKGLFVSVYRQRRGSCTNFGVSDRFDEFTLIGTDIDKNPIEGPFEPSEKQPALLCKIHYGGLIAVPVGDPRMGDGRHTGPMFGGNFVYSSDSRFPNRYPIPVHDRFEGPNMYQGDGD